MRHKYRAKDFRDSFPEWKRKKDSFLVRHLFRPLSFYTAAFAANLGLSANQVSLISLPVGVISACLFLIPSRVYHILGAILAWIWMLMDCTDGNIARTIKKEKYGEFIDALSSYVFLPLLFIGLGMGAYLEGGILLSDRNPWFILLGAYAGLFDVLPRLAYQKLRFTELSEGYGKAAGIQDQGKAYKRILRELGLNGLFLPALLVCSSIGALDILILFYFCIQSLLFAGSLAKMIKQTFQI